MNALFDLLKQNQPQFQTNQALLVIGPQNDFIAADGKLPVDTATGFLDRIASFVPAFRDNAGDIIWVLSAFESERKVNDPSGVGDTVLTKLPNSRAGSNAGDESDGTSRSAAGRTGKRNSGKTASSKTTPAQTSPKESTPAGPEDELFLSHPSAHKACCTKGSNGFKIADSIKPLMDMSVDTMVVTTNYSAFNGTALLMRLRAKLITELYVCGCITNISVYATVLDAAKHGFTINLIEDCLGYRRRDRHTEAIRQMVDFMAAEVVTSGELLAQLEELEEDERAASVKEATETDDDGLSAMVSKLAINESSRVPPPKNKNETDQLSDLLGKLEVDDDGDGDDDDEQDEVTRQVQSMRSIRDAKQHISKTSTRTTRERSERSRPSDSAAAPESSSRMSNRDKAAPPGPSRGSHTVEKKKSFVRTKIRRRKMPEEGGSSRTSSRPTSRGQGPAEAVRNLEVEEQAGLPPAAPETSRLDPTGRDAEPSSKNKIPSATGASEPRDRKTEHAAGATGEGLAR